MLDVLLMIIVFSIVWFVVGCVIMSIIDSDNRELFGWAKDAPFPFGPVVVAIAWPVVLYFWWRK